MIHFQKDHISALLLSVIRCLLLQILHERSHHEIEDIIDNTQPVFFRVAMDTQMRIVVNDVKLQLNDSYHNLIEIEKQIIHYLNLIAYQNRIFEKVRRLK